MSAPNGSYNFKDVCLPTALDSFLGGVNPSEIHPQENPPPILSAGSMPDSGWALQPIWGFPHICNCDLLRSQIFCDDSGS